MAKLGYTWYPKDWGNSESVFELNLSDRGLYRELIDLAMLNDNKTEIKLEVWSRKFAVEIDTLKSILNKLSILNLIEIKEENLFIPSCESRLNLSRGGKNSKPTSKGISNLKNQISEPISEPISEQIEKKVNRKEIENKNDLIFNELIISESWIESVAMKSKQKFIPTEVKIKLKDFTQTLNNQFDIKINKTDFCSHFTRWLDKQEKKTTTNKPLLL